MARHTHRFQTPPAADPIAAVQNSSLAFRLNFGFLLRQLAMFAVMDFLLFAMVAVGFFLYGENRCAEVMDLVEERGVPTADTIPWMEASDYTIEPLDRPPHGYPYSPASWLPWPREGRRYTQEELDFFVDEGLEPGVYRSWDLSSYYRVELYQGMEPYAITVDMSGAAGAVRVAGIVLLACQGLSLLTSLFGTGRSVKKALRPIQDLAATAARLNATTHMSRRELETLAGALEKIDASHLDSRIDLPATQKELRFLAQAINEMMDRVNQAYGAQMRFVSDASHELRTPIAVIQGYAALLDRWGKSDPEALQESIDAIRQEAASMERLVEQLLFLARGDNDSQPVKRERLELTALAGEVLREEEMIHPERTFLPHWGEEPVLVYADPGLIKQVLRILMDNGLKYSPEEGKLYLRVTLSGACARITVQDEGMGIPAHDIPHIFERFYRTDRSRDRKTGGTGLGLSIAKWIVDRHGGWFEVVSQPDLGTRITAVLPALSDNGKEAAP